MLLLLLVEREFNKMALIIKTFKHLKGRFGAVCHQCPTGRVFQYRVGSGRVLEKIPGSGSGSGRVGVLKYTIGYFRVPFLLPGNSGYYGYFRVFRIIHK